MNNALRQHMNAANQALYDYVNQVDADNQLGKADGQLLRDRLHDAEVSLQAAGLTNQEANDWIALIKRTLQTSNHPLTA